MNHYRFYTTLFLIITLIGLASVCYANGIDIDLAIERMEEVIAGNEEDETEIMANIMIIELSIDEVYAELDSISMSIEQTDMFIVDAKERIAAAQNDAQRAEWQAVLDNLESYRSELADNYTYNTYLGELYNQQLRNSNDILQQIRAILEWAEAELEKLKAEKAAQQNN